MLLLAIGVVLAAPVVAPTPLAPPSDPIQVNAWIDAPLTAAGFGVWGGLHLAQPAMVGTPCPCTRGQVNAFDRIAIGGHSTFAEPAANALFIGALGVALAAPIIANQGETWGEDALLVLQSVALAGTLTELSKIAVGRPYPYMYGPAPFVEQNADGVNYASFWSGHTAVPMAAAVTAARLIEIRDPDSPWRWVAWIVGPSLALGSGIAQIVASNHFPSDVIVGAGVGVGVGLLVPWLHSD